MVHSSSYTLRSSYFSTKIQIYSYNCSHLLKQPWVETFTPKLFPFFTFIKQINKRKYLLSHQILHFKPKTYIDDSSILVLFNGWYTCENCKLHLRSQNQALRLENAPKLLINEDYETFNIKEKNVVIIQDETHQSTDDIMNL